MVLIVVWQQKKSLTILQITNNSNSKYNGYL